MSKEKKINVEGKENAPETNTEEKVTAQQTQAEEPKADDVKEEAEAQDVAEAETETAEQGEAKEDVETVNEWKDKYIRLYAEFDNYKKRTLKEKAELILNGSEKTINAILPVADDFERAMADPSDDPKAIKDGLELIFKKFEKALDSLGVKKIETQGKDFDVDYHEAIAMVPGSDEQKGKVIDCVQTGYTLNDKVIRHAKVAVGQ